MFLAPVGMCGNFSLQERPQRLVGSLAVQTSNQDNRFFTEKPEFMTSST